MTRASDEARIVDAPVWRVTALEDRALVQRRAHIELSAGSHLLRVDDVTPLLVDRSLRGSVRAAEGSTFEGRLLEVQALREATLEETRPAAIAELLDADRALRAQQAQEQAKSDALRAERAALGETREALIEHLAHEAGRGLAKTEQWTAALDALEKQRSAREEALEALEEALRTLQQAQAQLAERLVAARTPRQHYRATLLARVELSAPARIELAWDYLVPCALWRPAHRAELEVAGAKEDEGDEGETTNPSARLRWTLLGTVWQRTGEAWQEIELALSTERAALGGELPLLDDDDLTLRPKTDAERQQIEVSARDETIAVLTPGVDEGVAASALPGVDDGGEVRVFELPGKVTIPPDGRAHQVELGHFETDAQLDALCMPELVPAVLWRSQQQNAGTRPLLAGPVHLQRDGGYLGLGQIGFVASGERFALGWGSNDELAVVRQAGRVKEKTSLTGRTSHRAWARVFISNTASEARTLTLEERIPVSELEEVQIRLRSEDTSPGYQLDDDGHLTWRLTLEPGEGRQVELNYLVEAHRKVVWR